MSDFNFYLNRQGVRGAKGAKGDKGDAPIISVDKQSANEFVLKVNNPDGTSITSPNLVGQQIQVTNSGDIVKYNRDTDSFYTSELDRATTEIEGIVRYATLTDVDSKEGGAVVGTDIFAQAISNVVSSPDGSIVIDYDQANEETTLKIGGTLVTDVTDLKGRMTTAESEIVNTQGNVAALDADMATKQNKLVQGDNITLTENADGTTTISAAGGELPDNIAYTDVTNTFISVQNLNGSLRLGYYDTNSSYTSLMFDEICYYKKGVAQTKLRFWSGDFYTTNLSFAMFIDSNYALKIAKDSDNNCLKIRTYDNNNIADTTHYFLRDIDVDGQTIQVVDGKLHANLDEIGGEVSDVSARVTTLEGQVGGISTTVDSNTTDIGKLKETKNNNIFDIGKFTVVGSPTITDDGIASGFSVGNYIRLSIDNISTSSNYQIDFHFNTDSTSMTQTLVGTSGIGNNFAILLNANKLMLFAGSGSDWDIASGVLGNTIIEENNDYIVSFIRNQDNYVVKILNKNTGIENTDITIQSSLNIGGLDTFYIGERAYWDYASASKFDLKHFSITVDGKEVFNGLMNSTKPIYDKISTINTNVSDFELETNNNFSAVNSALNEKVNFSDLSKYVPLADFNRLSNTVTSLEGQVGDVSAVLDNINGEVI